jgi:hypothetical protein
LVHVTSLTPIILRRLPNFLKIFKTLANASCTLCAHLHCKTDDSKSEAVLHRRVQMSFVDIASKRIHREMKIPTIPINSENIKKGSTVITAL